MKIEYLKWDSDFFKKKIGKIDWPKYNLAYDNIIPLLLKGKEEGYNLIYCFGDKKCYIDPFILNQFNGALVDRKVVFEGNTKITLNNPICVNEYNSNNGSKSLEKLTLLSGQYSRFQKEPYFTCHDFNKLYKQWLRNSLNKEIADKIFVIQKSKDIFGMITVKIKKDRGVIGLMAVDDTVHGKGYGTQLITAVKKYLSDNSIDKLEVATQLANEQACSFYKKNDLKVNSITNIFHFGL